MINQNFIIISYLVFVEAGVRVLGCACDNDGSKSLSWKEVSTEECVIVQNWIFGQNMDEDTFNLIDVNGDGNVDGNELADALEYFFGEGSERD